MKTLFHPVHKEAVMKCDIVPYNKIKLESRYYNQDLEVTAENLHSHLSILYEQAYAKIKESKQWLEAYKENRIYFYMNYKQSMNYQRILRTRSFQSVSHKAPITFNGFKILLDHKLDDDEIYIGYNTFLTTL